jgi:hypothetical protein
VSISAGAATGAALAGCSSKLVCVGTAVGVVSFVIGYALHEGRSSAAAA